MKPILTIPDFMPLSAEQRAWLQGYYAGMAMQAEMSVSTGAGLSSFAVDILIGTQTGNAEGLAEEMALTLGGAGAQARLHQLDDVEMDALAEMENVLVIASTYGEGEMPDNGHLFWDALAAETAPRLEAMNFSVLALGDTAYDEFCAAGKMIDKRFEQLGARRIADRVDCDVDYEDLAAGWSASVMDVYAPLIAEAAPAAGAAGVGAGGAVAASKKSKWTRKNPFPTQLTVNRRLSGPNSRKDIRHYEVALLGEDAPTYEAGDAVNVVPVNDPALVQLWLDRLGMKADSAVPGQDRPLAELMLRDWEISTPSKDFLKVMAQKSGDDELHHVLEHNDKQTLEDYVWNKDALDLMLDFPKVTLDLNEVAVLFRPLQHRAYSISSSSKVHRDSVHMTISTVQYHNNKRLHQGVASGYLADRVAEGEAEGLSVFMSPNKNFRVPEAGDVPIIMVGPGTGVAPFRAFLQERQATGASGGNWLFFGDQTRSDDYIYADELEAMKADGILSRLDLAFSRDQDTKVYVQHRMKEQGKALFDWLEQGAHFYVCGDATRMAKDVDEALHDIIAEQAGTDEAGARDYVNAMKKAKRYARDVY